MKYVWLSACCALTTAFTSAYASEPVKVLITPQAYYLGDVKSPLATPIVDEVVRMEPEQVLIVAYKGTPSSRIIQLQIEMKARYAGETRMFFKTNCPVA